MGFRFHPPTRSKCRVCEELAQNDISEPIIETFNGKASSSNGYPFHDWYNFVLGFTPVFPEYILESERINSDDIVLDPFAGSGTTQLVCKLHGIPSIGLDANDFMVYAAKQKLDWDIDILKFENASFRILKNVEVLFEEVNWDDFNINLNELRPEMLDKRYLSDKPFYKMLLVKNAISSMEIDVKTRNLLNFALSTILVPVSNVKYGPGFGIGKIKDDVDVLSIFKAKLNLMINNLKNVTEKQINTQTNSILGDSRMLCEYIKQNSISLIITSPPYPGDHEYTKHSRLELIFEGMATDLSSFRQIKKRMLRASTTNIYREDNERENVKNLQSIIVITDLIDARLKQDNASSGFEKLYTKLIWEYFGGMYKTILECFNVLRPGGKIVLLVSDSHAFKMVHIQTAKILEEIGEMVGFENTQIILWQMKNSTSHKYKLRENILVLQKPY